MSLISPKSYRKSLNSGLPETLLGFSISAIGSTPNSVVQVRNSDKNGARRMSWRLVLNRLMMLSWQ
ncbi:hypothetical protein COLO4_09242 [Corchorus olitorius]|uniref:Uncharacterized protein n=1 Tax=Corchorus olitorius TaxID=93759 RepID=A0A1R3KCV6_9ROSI|nr:hypothetical protein COLO4_09242 [Corchorus olitorius]